MYGTVNKIKVKEVGSGDNLWIVRHGEGHYKIREVVTKNGYFIEWPGIFSSESACIEEIKKEAIFTSNREK